MSKYVVLILLLSPALAAQTVYENAHEFTSSGDFDGNGGEDVLVVDRDTGQYRIGYDVAGTVTWSDVRASGVAGVTGIAVGPFIDPAMDAIAFTSPESNALTVVAADSQTTPGTPQTIDLNAIGSNALVAIDLGGGGNTPHDDLLVASFWNDLPNNGRFNLVRADGTFTDLTNLVHGVVERGSKVQLKPGGLDYAAVAERGTSGDRLHVYDFSTGAQATMISMSGLPMGFDYAMGDFNGSGVVNIITYVPGTTGFTSWPVTEPSPNVFNVGAPVVQATTFIMEQLTVVPNPGGAPRLAVLHNHGAGIEIFEFDGSNAPSSLQVITPNGYNSNFSSMPVLSDGRFLALTNNGAGEAGMISDVYQWSGSDYSNIQTDNMPLVFAGAAPATVLLFENEPFVNEEPNLVRALSVGQWSTAIDLTGGITVTNESYQDETTGLGASTNNYMGSTLANENFALANQYRPDVAVSGFTRALGSMGLDVTISPAAGNYRKLIQVSLTASDPGATIYYRLDSNSNWQTYSAPLSIFTDTDLQAYARLSPASSQVKTASYRFQDSSGNMDSDNDGLPDYVELANGLDPNASGIDSDGDGFSDLEELILGSDPTDDGSTPSGWTPSSASPRPSLELQSAFNMEVTPLPYDGTADATTDAQSNERLVARDPQGNHLAEGQIGVVVSKRKPLLWLNAAKLDKSDGEDINTWDDLRIDGDPASYVLDGPGGLPAVRFAGKSRLLGDELKLEDYTLFVVFREQSGAQAEAVLLDGALRLDRDREATWGLRGAQNKRVSAPFPSGETQILTAVRQQGRLTLIRDDKIVGMRVGEALASEGLLVIGGPAADGGGFFRGEIAELILFDGQLDAGTRKAMLSQLQTRYKRAANVGYLAGLSTESPLVIVSSDPHFKIVTANAEDLIGRELIGAYASAALTPVTVPYTYGGGDPAVEAAAWLTVAQAAYTSAARETVVADLHMKDTLSLLMLEYKLASILQRRGELSDEKITLTPHRPNDAERLTLSEEQIAALAMPAENIDNGYKLADVVTEILDELNTSTNTDVVQLSTMLTQIYDQSSAFHHVAPRNLRLPFDALRDFIYKGELDDAYVTALGLTSTQLSSALAGVHHILGKISGRPLQTYILTVTETSFNGPCVTLETDGPDPLPISLFNVAGEPYDLFKAGGIVLVPGVQLEVMAYGDSNANACSGEDVVEVISAKIFNVPLPSAQKRRTPVRPEEPEQETPFVLTVSETPVAPEVADGYQNILEVLGEEGRDTLGTWWIEDTSLVGEGGRGYASYTLAPQLGDRFRLELDLGGDQDVLTDFHVRLWINGAYLGRHQIQASHQTRGLLHVKLPWLPAGEHELRILWDDLPKSDPFIIHALRLQAKPGEDKDKDGVKDWIADDLYTNNYVDMAPMTSRVSPVTIEGYGDYASMIGINGAALAKPALSGRWYARVPLEETAPTKVEVSFQNEAIHEDGYVEWVATNILETDEITIRKGDALRLTAHGGDLEGSYLLHLGDINHRANADAPMVHRFEEPGEFIVEAAHRVAGGGLSKSQLKVNVLDDQVPDAALWVGNTRKWDLRELNDEVVLEADEDLELVEMSYLPNGGRRTELTTSVAETRRVVARMSVGGPILAVAEVNGFQVYTANETYIHLVERHEDGSQTIAVGLVATPLPEDAEIRLTVIVGGVSFADGTIRKKLKASDFDALGVAEVHFNRAADAKTAVCHVTEAYQNYVFVGTVKQLREEASDQ